MYEYGLKQPFADLLQYSCSNIYRPSDMQRYQKQTPTQVLSCEYCEIFAKFLLWLLLYAVFSSPHFTIFRPKTEIYCPFFLFLFFIFRLYTKIYSVNFCIPSVYWKIQTRKKSALFLTQ